MRLLDPVCITDLAFERFDLAPLLDELRHAAVESYLVGGAVRDLLLDPESTPTDLDIMVVGDFTRLTPILDHLGAPRRNRHRNLRYPLAGGKHLDLIATDRFYGRATTIDDALRHFDLSANAMAISLADGAFHDPFDARRQLLDGLVSLPSARWVVGDPFEDVHVLLRAIRLVDRLGLRLTNPERARTHRARFDQVDWRDLERLNGFGRAAAERQYLRLFQRL
jgi:tRNA nucleotidyltransferase/poly(A) polymerase